MTAARKKALLIAVPLLVLLGVVAYTLGPELYWNITRHWILDDDQIATRFLSYCGDKEYKEAERHLAKYPQIVSHRFGLYDGTILHTAVSSFASTKPAELLLAHGADINAQDVRGMTPLDQAALVGNSSLLLFLSERGGRLSGVEVDTSIENLVERIREKYPDVQVTGPEKGHTSKEKESATPNE